MVMQAGVQSDGRPGVGQAAAEIDLGALGRALWRKKFLIVGLTLLTAALAFGAVSLITPRYKSEARVLIETRENIFLRPDAEKSLERSSTVDQEAVTSQVQLILSRDLAREIIKKLKLAERPEFDPVLRRPGTLQTILRVVGFAKDPLQMTPEERVLKSYYERLAAFQVEKSRVIAIEFESEDSELAAQAANAIAEGYQVLQQATKQDQTRSAGVWLAGEIERLRGKVAEAEGKVEQYRSKTNLFIGNNNTMLSNQQLGDFNAQLASARAQKADAEGKANMIREALRTGAAVEFSDIINSELMRRLSEQRVTLRAQLAEQSSTLLDQHPRIKELRAQIADLERQMRSEADRLARSLENDAKLASTKVDSLSVGLDQLKRQAASSNEQDVQLRALERDAKSQRDLLESYLAKYREATARDSIGAASPDARIISTAVVSTTPAWPKKVPTVLVAALAMFALSAGFVLTSALLGSLPTQSAVPSSAAPVMPPADAQTEGDRPAIERVALAVGRPVARPAASVLEAARAAAGVPLEAVEALAHDLAAAGEGARRITVIGTLRNVGTTMAAITLARSLGKQARVALVDLALGSPNLSVIAADPTVPGIAELVRGSASFGQIITRDRFSSVHLIMAGREAIDPSAIMTSQRLSITLEALARSYDHVVVDAGTVGDAALDRFANLAPRAVLVAGELDDPATMLARERLLQAGFADVNVLVGAPRGPEIGAKAAA
jgi:polysaccharide biosynthesis transport protein